MENEQFSSDDRLESPRFGTSRDFANMDRLLSRESKTIIAYTDLTRFQRIEEMSETVKLGVPEVGE